MDSIVQAKIKRYLQDRLNVGHYECNVVLTKIRELARAAGHALDSRFGRAGLGSGPEGRLASSIVDRALGGGGSATADNDIRLAVDKWIRSSPPKA